MRGREMYAMLAISLALPSCQRALDTSSNEGRIQVGRSAAAEVPLNGINSDLGDSPIGISQFRTAEEQKAMLRSLPSLDARTPLDKELRQRSRRLVERVQRISIGSQPCALSAQLLLTVGRTVDSLRDEIDLTTEIIGRVIHSKEISPFVVRSGRPYPRSDGPPLFLQQHPDEFLYDISAAGLSIDTPLSISGSNFTLRDLLLTSMSDVDVNGDLEWSVSAYTWFLSPEASWTNKYGSHVRFVDLLNAVVDKKSEWCGGAHRATALARSLAWCLQSTDAPTSALRARVSRALQDEITQIVGRQLPNGGFMYIESQVTAKAGRGRQDEDIMKSMQLLNTAHALEWIVVCPPELAAPQSALDSAVEFVLASAGELCEHIEQSRLSENALFAKLTILAHACHAMNLAFSTDNTLSGKID